MDASQFLIAPYTQQDLQNQVAFGVAHSPDGPQIYQDSQDYVAGINAYIANAKMNPNLMPGEYTALGMPQRARALPGHRPDLDRLAGRRHLRPGRRQRAQRRHAVPVPGPAFRSRAPLGAGLARDAAGQAGGPQARQEEEKEEEEEASRAQAGGRRPGERRRRPAERRRRPAERRRRAQDRQAPQHTPRAASSPPPRRAGRARPVGLRRLPGLRSQRRPRGADHRAQRGQVPLRRAAGARGAGKHRPARPRLGRIDQPRGQLLGRRGLLRRRGRRTRRPRRARAATASRTDPGRPRRPAGGAARPAGLPAQPVQRPAGVRSRLGIGAPARRHGSAGGLFRARDPDGGGHPRSRDRRRRRRLPRCEPVRRARPRSGLRLERDHVGPGHHRHVRGPAV